MSELIAAATVIPLRDSPDGLEVLMLRKNSKVSFGGMWVFPGGRVDDADVRADVRAGVGASVEAGVDDEETARRAAAREALEEADLLLDPTAMVTFSHWTPPEQEVVSAKRFATWFFAARAPVGEDGEVTIDGGEIHDDVWVSPSEMLARRQSGDIQLAPPTVVTLLDLAAHDDVDAVLTAAAGRTPFRYLTRVAAPIDGQPMALLWGGDVGYDTGDATLPGPRHRLLMAEDGWRYERTT